MLCYAMLCFTKEQFLNIIFLAMPLQPNGHDDQMVLVDPLEGDKSDTPTIHRHPWHGLDHGPAHDHDHNHDHGLDSHGLSSHDPDLGPQHFMHVGYSSTT